MNEIISVIVPVYNTEPYLKRCIESVLNQTYGKFELILVDDGSTDKSGLICDSYVENDKRIKVIHKKNTGVSDSRNVGLLHVTGKYFMFLDSDDSLERETLQKCYEKMELDDADGLVFGWQQIKNNYIVEQGIYETNVLTDMKQAVYDILADRHIYGGGYPNKLWRTESFKHSLNEIPKFNNKLFYVEDMEWVIRMFLKSKKIIVIRNVFYNYYLRDNSVSTSFRLNEKRLVGYHDTMKKILDNLEKYDVLYVWFQGVAYTELINSTIDAFLKRQKTVFRELYCRLLDVKQNILQHRNIKTKVKIRYILILVLGRGLRK